MIGRGVDEGEGILEEKGKGEGSMSERLERGRRSRRDGN